MIKIKDLEGQGQLYPFIIDQLTVSNYFYIVQSMMEAIRKAWDSGEQVKLELGEISYKNGRILFATVNEDSIIEMDTIKKFLKDITFECVFGDGEEWQRITDFLQFLDDVDSCQRLEDIFEYCLDENYEPEDDIIEEPQVQATPAPQYENVEQSGMSYYDEDEDDGQGETGVLDASYWDRLEQQNQVRSGQGQISRTIVRNNAGPFEATADSYDDGQGETGVLDASYWNQMERKMNMAPMPAPVRTITARLVNVKAGIETVINKNEFWVGKESADLRIDRPTVSRKHAMINSRDGHYFIMDNGSTNKTYVEGNVIPPKASVEIYNGTKIKFANEEYIFKIGD